MAGISPTNDRHRPASWGGPILFVLAYAALAPVAVYASKGTVVLLALTALALSSVPAGFAYLFRMLSTPFGLALALLIVWAFITTAWAPGGWVAGFAALRVALVCLAGLLSLAAIAQLDTIHRRIPRAVLAISGCAMLAFFALEIVTDGALAGFLKGRVLTTLDPVGRGTAILAVVVWPICALLTTRARGLLLASSFLLGAFALTYLLPMVAGFLALIVGLVVFAAVYAWRRTAIAAIFGAVALFTLTAPEMYLDLVNLETAPALTNQLPGNWQHRLAVWRFTSSRVAEQPVIGHGFDAARVIGREHVTGFLQLEDSKQRKRVALMPLHPHNAPLQIWLELGLVGVACVLGMLFGVSRLIWQQMDRPFFAATASASLASFLCVASISFGVWQNWWVATGWLSAGVLALVAPDLPARLTKFGEACRPPPERA
jgi:O-antigen ligase